MTSVTRLGATRDAMMRASRRRATSSRIHDDPLPAAVPGRNVSGPADRGAIVWTADCSATVQLGRCVGPRTGHAQPPACWAERCGCVDGSVPLNLAEPTHKAALYECLLGGGTPFDIYRWINLDDLAELWPRLQLSAAVRAEWGAALTSLGLLDRS